MGSDAVRPAEPVRERVHALYVMDTGDAAFVATPSDIAEIRRRLEHEPGEFLTGIRIGIPEERRVRPTGSAGSPPGTPGYSTRFDSHSRYARIARSPWSYGGSTRSSGSTSRSPGPSEIG